MHRTNPLTRLAAAVALLVSAAAAQTFVVCPYDALTSSNASSTRGWLSSASGFRTQCIYDASLFADFGVNGPCVIHRMRFRAVNGTTYPGGTYAGDGVSFGVTVDIGTSAVDYTAASSNFAANRGAMQNVLSFATVAVTAAPLSFVIDIPIPGGFAYDPTLGQDLILDITGPPFSPPLAGPPAYDYGRGSTRTAYIDAMSAAATTGTVRPNEASLVLFDITGPGGIPNDGSGNPMLVVPTVSSFGSACGVTATRTFAELFPGAPTNTALDLGSGITLTPDNPGAPNSYTVTAGANAIAPHGSTRVLTNFNGVAMGDDSTSQPQSLGFTFPYPGGSTSIVHAASNGYVLLTTVQTNVSDSSASLADLIVRLGPDSSLPRLLPCWHDFDPTRNLAVNPSAGIYFDTDPVNGVATITWDDIGEFGTTTAGASRFTFQVTMTAAGTVEYRYGSMSPFGTSSFPPGDVKLVGFTRGAPSGPATSIDLSASMPFQSGPLDSLPLALSATRPYLNGTCTLTTAFVPPPGVTINFLSFARLVPAVDLSPLAINGCFANIDLGAEFTESQLLGTGTVAYGAPVPGSLSLIGLSVYSQSASLAPGFNPFGAMTSNGLTLTIGTIP